MSSEAIARCVPVEGACNFRDFGGYRGADGRTVRWRQLYRSNKLSELTPADCATIDALGIRAVFDLRAGGERRLDPTNWSCPPEMIRTYPPGHKRRLIDMALDYPPTPAGALDLMHDFYAEMPLTMAHIFGAILREVAHGATPCVIHCSAGKDRTGVAAALILAALGVSREEIVADYELTAKVGVFESHIALETGHVERGGRLYPPEAVAIMRGARGSYLEAAFAGIERAHGSLEAYFHDALGLAPAELDTLRAGLLE